MRTLFRPWLALWLALLGAWLPATPARAAEPAGQVVGGVNFERQIQLAGQSLLLNGAGLRAVLFLKGYAAGLYLPQRAADAEAVVSQPGAKRLQMKLLLDVPVAEFVKALHVGIERNIPADRQAVLTERVARFDALLQPLGKVKKGDLVNLDFVPGQGLQFWLNGKQQGTAIPGDDFYAALLKVFIGAHVSDDKLRAGLLGKPA